MFEWVATVESTASQTAIVDAKITGSEQHSRHSMTQVLAGGLCHRTTNSGDYTVVKCGIGRHYKNQLIWIIFWIKDINHPRFISLDEFGESWETLSSHVNTGITYHYICDLVQNIHSNKDGHNDINKLLETLSGVVLFKGKCLSFPTIYRSPQQQHPGTMKEFGFILPMVLYRQGKLTVSKTCRALCSELAN